MLKVSCLLFPEAKEAKSPEAEEEEEEEEDSLIDEFTNAWNLKKSEMETIQEELHDLAFENRAYGSLLAPENIQNPPPYVAKLMMANGQQDSGFESSSDYKNSNFESDSQGENYENVSPKRGSRGQQKQKVSDGANFVARKTSGGETSMSSQEEYESVSLADLEQEDPQKTISSNFSEYQNIDVGLSAKILNPNAFEMTRKKRRDEMKSLPPLNNSSIYQNMEFASLSTSPPAKDKQKVSSGKIPTPSDDYAVPRKRTEKSQMASAAERRRFEAGSERHQEDGPIYENYDFGEEAVYQNMIAADGKIYPAKNNDKRKSSNIPQARRKSAPSKTNNDDDEVYAQVKFLRKTVQEVNALLEKDSRGSNRQRRSNRRSKSQGNLRQNCSSEIAIVPRPTKFESKVIVKKPPPPRSHSKPEIANSQEESSRKAHFRALLSRFDNSNERCESSSTNYPPIRKRTEAENRKSSLPVSLSRCDQGGHIQSPKRGEVVAKFLRSVSANGNPVHSS